MPVLCLLPHFRILYKSVHIAYFPLKLAFLTVILVLFVFLLPISIRFRYLDHLVANRMAPSVCPDPCGTGVQSFKKKWGTHKARLRQRFLNNLGLHTRTLIHVRKIATADLRSCPAIQLLVFECL